MRLRGGIAYNPIKRTVTGYFYYGHNHQHREERGGGGGGIRG